MLIDDANGGGGGEKGGYMPGAPIITRKTRESPICLLGVKSVLHINTSKSRNREGKNASQNRVSRLLTLLSTNGYSGT